MKEIKQSKEQLKKRRNEINAQLNKVNKSEEINLDRHMEDQAIETEQHDVSVTMEENLRREIIDIEDKLATLNK